MRPLFNMIHQAFDHSTGADSHMEQSCDISEVGTEIISIIEKWPFQISS